MSKTQRITIDWLMQTGLSGDELLLECLLRRGFLAFQDEDGIWLGTGTHLADVDVLRLVDGLELKSIPRHPDRMVAVSFRLSGKSQMHVAKDIIALPEHHIAGRSRWTSCGIAPFVKGSWVRYREMTWGAKLPACPAKVLGAPRVDDALDLGVALLVKVFPLARIATSFSCDGHGEQPATISFHFEWDSYWGEAVFNTLCEKTPHSSWRWREGGGNLQITPLVGFSDSGALGMLSDIQLFARRLLNRAVIEKLGVARRRTLDCFGDYPPGVERFAEEARRQLAPEFTQHA